MQNWAKVLIKKLINRIIWWKINGLKNVLDKHFTIHFLSATNPACSLAHVCLVMHGRVAFIEWLSYYYWHVTRVTLWILITIPKSRRLVWTQTISFLPRRRFFAGYTTFAFADKSRVKANTKAPNQNLRIERIYGTSVYPKMKLYLLIYYEILRKSVADDNFKNSRQNWY